MCTLLGLKHQIWQKIPKLKEICEQEYCEWSHNKCLLENPFVLLQIMHQPNKIIMFPKITLLGSEN